MATYDTGYLPIILTIEGAARANELNKNGIEVKVTHMRVYRSPTAIQNLPHQFNGNETRAILDTWTCLPNPETVFEVIEDFDTSYPNGMLKLVGTLGADVGTFNYDAVGLFLADDTLYGIGATSRLLTKRKAYFGSSANVHELRFALGHQTVNELARFVINETVIDYTKIQEVEFVHQLPNEPVPKDVIYRVSNNSQQAYHVGVNTFKTWLASQRSKTIGSETANIWFMHDHIQLFERMNLNFTIHSGQVHLAIPISSKYPVDLIPTDREVIISFFNPNNAISVPAALKLKLVSKITDSTTYVLTFQPIGTSIVGVLEYTQIRGNLYIHGSDCIYQDAIQSAIKTMTEIEYSPGRTFKTDNSDINPGDVLQSFWNKSSSWVKLDSKVEVATSVFAGRLFNPSQLQPIVFKAGDIKHMKLRATNIWLNTATGTFQPTLTLNRGVAVFGDTIIATITVPGAVAGTQVAWYTRTPDKAGLFLEPTNTIGYVTLDANGVGSVEMTIDWTKVNAQYKIYFGLVGYNLERQCLLMPIEGEVYFSADPQGSSRIDSINEGSTAYLIARTTHPFNNLELYLVRENGTIINQDDFLDTIPFSVTLNNGFSSTELRVKEDHATEGVEALLVGLYANPARTIKLGPTASITINDSSVAPIASYEMFMSGDQNSDAPLGGESNLGDTVWLIVKGYNIPPIHEVTLDFSGDFNLIADAEPDIQNPLTLTLVNGRAAYRIASVAPVVEPPTGGGPTGPVKRSLNITTTRTTTFNIYNEFVAAYGTPPDDVEVTVNVYPDVYVVGTDTNSPAIDGRGPWGGGAVLKIENKGKIYGRGGDGATGVNAYIATPRPATNGGIAIIAQNANPLYVNNYVSQGADIKGGGGGGGTVEITLTNVWTTNAFGEFDKYDYGSFEASGGGGQPLGKGGGDLADPAHSWCAAREFCKETWYPIRNMTDATLTAPSGIRQDFWLGWISNGDGDTLTWSTQAGVPGVDQQLGFISAYGGVVGAAGNLQYDMPYFNVNPLSPNASPGATSQGLVYISNL
jgi:hypothetical protein